MNIAGLDLSLTATGIATADGVDTIKTNERGVRRLFWLRRQILKAITESTTPVDAVALEGYSYASQHSHAHSTGELGGVIRLGLWEAGIRYIVVPPKSMKKFATGKGNASKDQVLVSAVLRFGREFADNNQADALWLRAMAHQRYGEPIVDVPQSHLVALDGVVWPRLREGVKTA